MINLTTGFYTVNAFNLGDVLLSFDHFEQRENVVYYPKIFRYVHTSFDNIQYSVNEFGSGVSWQIIPNATTMEEAKDVYNNHDYYYPTYKHLIRSINNNFGSNIENTEISFIVEISEEKKPSEYAEIAIHNNKHFQFFLAVFTESMFILELCWLMERRLVSLLQQKRSYYSQRILAEFASNLFIIENPKGYLPNHDEFEYMKELYEAWSIGSKVESLKSKFDLALTNYKFSLEYDERRQNMLTTLLLGSITVFSVNQTVPVIYQAFPKLNNYKIFNQQIVLLCFSFVAIAIAGYTFWKYSLAEFVDKLNFRFRQYRLNKKLK